MQNYLDLNIICILMNSKHLIQMIKHNMNLYLMHLDSNLNMYLITYNISINYYLVMLNNVNNDFHVIIYIQFIYINLLPKNMHH